MKETNYCRYIEEYGICVIDYSGNKDLAEELARIDKLYYQLKEYCSSDKSLKILVDARKYIMRDPYIHNMLAKTARESIENDFINIEVITAVLNNKYSNSVDENESWFISEEEAMNWLISK